MLMILLTLAQSHLLHFLLVYDKGSGSDCLTTALVGVSLGFQTLVSEKHLICFC